MAAAVRGWLRPRQAAGRRPPRRRGSSLFLLPAEPCRAWPSPAEPSRAQPSVAEHSRAQPNPTPGPPPPPERRRASEPASGRGRGGGAAPGGGGARSPQTARGRGRPGRAAAGAAGGGCAAEGEGRGRGDAVPARRPPPPARRLRASVGAQHPAAPDPPRARPGLHSGAGLQVDVATAQESLRVDGTASAEGRRYRSPPRHGPCR
nr:adropin isoform X1 [Equus asinus]